MTEHEIDLLAALGVNDSIRGVARARGWSVATTSRHLAALEERLRHPLFLRRGRSLVATREGQALIERARGTRLASQELLAYAERLREGGEDRLVVAASPLFAELVMPAAIDAFSRRRPHVRIELRVGHDATELHAGRIDVAFRRGPLADLSSLRAKKLGRTTMVCVASSPADASSVDARIAAMRWIRVGASAEALTIEWGARGKKRRRARVVPHVTVDSQRVAIELALRAPFAVRVNAFVAREHLLAGRLVEIVPEARTSEDVFAVFPDRPRPDVRSRELVEHVAIAAAAAGIWDEGTRVRSS